MMERAAKRLRSLWRWWWAGPHAFIIPGWAVALCLAAYALAVLWLALGR